MSGDLIDFSAAKAAAEDRGHPREIDVPSPPATYDEAIAAAAHAVAEGLPLPNLLHAIAVYAASALHADVVLIRTILPDNANFVVSAAAGSPGIPVSSLAGSYSTISDEVRACRPGSTISVELGASGHLTALPPPDRWEFNNLPGRRLLIVPMHAHGRLVGRLDLLRVTDEPFDGGTAAAALPFAAYAATSLSEQVLARVAEDQQAFQSVIGLHQAVEQPADPRAILQSVVELIVRDPGCARCYALLWNEDRAEFIPTAVAGLESQLVDILKMITLSPQLVPAFDQIIHTGRPIVVNDAANSTLLPVSLVRALRMKAAMVVPLRGRRRPTIGVLLLDQTDDGVGFTELQVTTMAGMARHLSMMLENAILFEEVRTTSESMAVINEIAIQLAMLADEESLFRQLHFQLAAVLDASHLAMGLLTPDRRSLDVRYAHDSSVVPGTQRIPLDTDPLSLTAASGRVELLGTRSAGEGLPWFAVDGEVEPAHSRLTVPLAVGRNVIGALMVQSPFRNAYGPRDVELLTSVALHAGIAIENARLYRIVQSRGDRRAVVLDEVINRQEAERKELVDDIHDDTLQVMASCLYRLDRVSEAIERPDQQEQALTQLQAVRDSLSENIARLRKRIFSLRPATLDRLGLEPSLRELVGGFGRDRGIDVELDIELPGRLTAEHEMVAYRVVQEALVHIVTRGGASRLRVRLRQRAGVVSITIQDDGAPTRHDMPPADELEDRSDITLLALIERAELAGGHMRVAHRAGGGSLMQITIPGQFRSETPLFEPDVSDGTETDEAESGEHGSEEQRAGS